VSCCRWARWRRGSRVWRSAPVAFLWAGTARVIRGKTARTRRAPLWSLGWRSLPRTCKPCSLEVRKFVSAGNRRIRGTACALHFSGITLAIQLFSVLCLHLRGCPCQLDGSLAASTPPRACRQAANDASVADRVERSRRPNDPRRPLVPFLSM
jgi:hypothetical protein